MRWFLLDAGSRPERSQVWLQTRRLLAKNLSELFLKLVVVLAELRRDRVELQIFCLHYCIHARAGRSPADRKDDLLAFLRKDEVDEQFRGARMGSLRGNSERMQRCRNGIQCGHPFDRGSLLFHF